MEVLLYVGRIVLTVFIAIVVGKLVSKLKLPAILGWLITGMALGPHALNLMSQEVMDTSWYHTISTFLECAVGVTFGRELIIKNLKKSGKQIVAITMAESIGTFLLVTLCFGVLFYFTNVPLYVAVIFGGIALATAPAPSLSIVNEFKSKGPISSALLPIAMLDDVIAIAIFFTVNSLVGAMGSVGGSNVLVVIFISVLLPFMLGIGLGYLASPLLKRKELTQKGSAIVGYSLLVIVFAVSYLIDNFVLPTPSLNYMMIGLAFFATLSNVAPHNAVEKISLSLKPIAGIGFIIMILNLAAPLDYRLILGAGVFTAIYIITRGLGKYFSTYFMAKKVNATPTMTKYLGFTLLPHSGVSLVFTGMAVTTLLPFDPESATLVQGTIASAAVINEIFAVIIAKKGLEWAGEIHPDKK